MKVLIVGSVRLADNATEQQKIDFEIKKKVFVAACNALGRAFAAKDQTIMVGVTNWQMLKDCNTVASYIVKGASEVPMNDGKPHPIIFVAPKTQEPPDVTPAVEDSLAELRKLPNLKFEDRFLAGKGDLRAKSITNVTEADAVVVICGAEGTAGIGYATYAMDKPCIALTSMGGSAEALSNDVLADDYERFVRQGDLSETDLRSLSEYWKTDETEDAKRENRTNADKIVRVTQMLVKAKIQAKKETFDVLRWILVGVASLLVFWLVVYYNMPHLARMVAFFGLLYATALVGAGLRNLVDYQSNAITRLTGFGLLIDLVISAVVAFGLALLYLVGGISFTGKVVVLDDTSEATAAAAYATISITMSVLGLAAGFLVPLKQLRDRLEKMFAEVKS